jgi:signal transduction histidine kinase
MKFVSNLRRTTLSLKIIVGCTVTLIIALGISFHFITERQERLIMGQVEREVRALFRQVVITRKWIADHGGVYIERVPWMQPSPYMPDPEIIDRAGKRYLIKTPAMVTKELSSYAREQGLYWFHITSLKLTNPENAPDDFERAALWRFEREGITEVLAPLTIDRSKYLRYIAPLYIEEACLRCHGKQAYRVGDIRGAISITVPIDGTLAEIAANKRGMIIANILTVLALVGAISFMMNRLVIRPTKQLQASIRDFSAGRLPIAEPLATGDEIEELSRAFTEMARTLSRYHDHLNDTITAATADLAETNLKLLMANQLLQEASERKSDFIARASHELRTPLTSIKGAMDYISAKLAAATADPGAHVLDDLSIFFEVIKKNAERLIRMVNTMLDLERIELGVSDFNFANLDLAQLADEVMTGFQPEAERKEIILRRALQGPLPVCADADRMRQVMINLLSNALKFSPDRTVITVTAERRAGHAYVEVRDQGPGIAPDEQSLVFDKFFKLRNAEGAGLGLAISRSITEAHGGEVGIAGDGADGCRIFFRLPLGDCGKRSVPSGDALPTV